MCSNYTFLLSMPKKLYSLYFFNTFYYFFIIFLQKIIDINKSKYRKWVFKINISYNLFYILLIEYY